MEKNMSIEEVLREMRAGLLPKKAWADAIEQAMRERDAQIQRLQTRVVAAYEEGWGDGITGCSFNKDWIASEARAAIDGKEKNDG